jgi:hypothetical protein
MFGRGSWAVFGIKKDTESSVSAALDSFVGVSQASAVAQALQDGVPTSGINPFGNPRLDEKDTAITAGLEVTSADFRLGEGVYGLWFCLNDHEDVTDPKSKQESLAYELSEKPFKFLTKDEKKLVDERVEASAVASRKQFPVLVDFNAERVFALTTKEEHIGELRAKLQALGAEVYNLSWQFGGYDWPTKFLNEVNGKNKFHAQMQSRADDLRRFRGDEIEKLEDKMLESIVSGYFAMSELDTGKWAGLTTPAKVRLFVASEPSSEASVSTAFTLMNLVDGATVASAAVVFQELDSWITKKDVEKQRRTDLFTIDINDKANISDAGAAALRGFDLPQFKKAMKKHAKDRGDLSIRDYWFEWHVAMKGAVYLFIDNVTETLQLDKEKFGMLAYEHAIGEENL